MLLASLGVHIGAGRMLGPVAYGHLSRALAVLLWCELGALGGFSVALPRLMAREPARAAAWLRLGLRLGLALSLGIGLALAALSPLLSRALAHGAHRWVYALAALDLPPYLALLCVLARLDGARRFAPRAVVLASYAAAKPLWMLGLIRLGFGVEGAIIGNGLASLTGLVAGAWALRRLPPASTLPSPSPGPNLLAPNPLEPGAAGQLMRLALPASGLALLLQLGLSLDLLLLGLTRQPDALVGVYSAASQMGRTPYLLVSAQAVLVVPLLASGAGGRHLEVQLRWLGWWAAAAVGLALPLAPGLLGLALGPAYAPGGAIVPLLMAAMVALGGFRLAALAGLATGDRVTPLRLGLAGLLVGGLGQLAGILWLGPSGAALGTLAGALSLCLMAWWRLGRRLSLRVPWRAWGGALLLGLVSGAIAAWLPGPAGLPRPVWGLLTGGGLYAAVLIGLGELSGATLRSEDSDARDARPVVADRPRDPAGVGPLPGGAGGPSRRALHDRGR